jgi:hypothetical protein
MSDRDRLAQLEEVIAANWLYGQKAIARGLVADGWARLGEVNLDGDTITVWPPGTSSYGVGVTLSLPDILAGNYVRLADADLEAMQAKLVVLDPDAGTYPTTRRLWLALAAAFGRDV